MVEGQNSTILQSQII